jgi:hypothetical protein
MPGVWLPCPGNVNAKIMQFGFYDGGGEVLPTSLPGQRHVSSEAVKSTDGIASDTYQIHYHPKKRVAM